MKLKFLFLILVLAGNCFAQSKDIKIEISIKENNWWKISAQNPLEIVVKNESGQNIDNKPIYLELIFSKCFATEKCGIRGDEFASDIGFENKSLAKNEVIKFEINLTDLYWVDRILSGYDFSRPKNFNVIPISNNRLYVELKIFNKDSSSVANKVKFAEYQVYKSNEIFFERKYISSK